MREYGKVSPQFWIGKTGKALRGNPEAQIVALYLMTSPHAEMTGIFHCPILYIAHETGLSIEGATKGLARLSEVGFSTFDEENELVFVHEMAKYQIGDDLKPTDNRVAGVQKLFSNMPDSFVKDLFFDRYKIAFLLDKTVSPLEAPLKPRAGAGARKEQTCKSKPASGKPEVSEGFAKFWQAWPASDRKAAKMECFKRWKAKGFEKSAAEIVVHVESVRSTKKWTDGYAPAPLTYLNQQHWLDGESGDSAKPWEL